MKKEKEKDSKILLIIPAYNEEENILNVYQTIKNYNKKNKPKYDVIVINDGSTDNTLNILESNKIPHINLIHNLGIGGAVQTGYKYAYANDYDIAIQFDGDGQHNVEYVENIIKPIINRKANMVIGSRFADKTTSEFKSTKIRQIGIKMLSIFMNIFTNQKIYDVTSGFRACDKELIKRFANSYPLEYPEPISTVEVIKSGSIVYEVPVKMNERIGGQSSIRKWKSIYYMINVFLSVLIVGTRRYK